MLDIPPQGLSVVSTPPSAADASGDLDHRQIMFITLNDQILSQIGASGGKGMTVTFGPNSVRIHSSLVYWTLYHDCTVRASPCVIMFFADWKCLQIGGQLHKFSGVVPESSSSPFEVYRHKKSSSNPKLDFLGRVTHKIQVRRGLDTSSMERIKNRTEEAERERNSRKYGFLSLTSERSLTL
jgi:hypothetical protein